MTENRLAMLRILSLWLALVSTSGVAADWTAAVRRDHPRLFFNAESWPAVKSRALGRESPLFAAMQSRVEKLAGPLIEDRDYGTEAAETALVFRVTGQTSHREIAERLLAHSAALYVRRHAQKRAVNWYTFSRINALAALDWLYNDLSPSRRTEIGRFLLAAARDAQPTTSRRPFIGPDLGGSERENWSDPTTGFYGTPSLLWFAGLAAFRDGIDDPLAEEFLRRGYALQIQLLEHRRKAAGDDGGSASATLAYWLGAYPWAEFNFFHTFLSATGRDISRDWPYVATLPGYIFWNWLPGMREFGSGDATHRTNQIPPQDVQTHLAQLAHFYGRSHPDQAAAAAWLAERAPRQDSRAFPWTRMLLTDIQSPGTATPKTPLARHFENMGQIFFRSGSGPGDTYALFTAGGGLRQHRHFDNNNFVIYKQGFLALDSGTRPQPGQHLSHYYCRTVAHNCILIRMPGESMPTYWGSDPGAGEEKLPYPNDGGQQSVVGSHLVAFESRPEYAYLAGDATATYNSAKCGLALRQFVFLAPDHFVVFDRVTSTDPSYRKSWTLHTVAEPALSGDTFSAEHEQGRLFVKTLLPARAVLDKVGGPGRQFWSDGRNWALPKGYSVPDTTPLLGQWRVEVSPSRAAREDHFLHLIQAGGPALAASSLVRGKDRAGVRFRSGANVWEVTFGTSGTPTGHIRLTRGGKTLVNRDLTRVVAPQSGL